MLNAQNLRAIHGEVQGGGEFDRKRVLAVLSHLIDMAERLEELERVFNIPTSDN